MKKFALFVQGVALIFQVLVAIYGIWSEVNPKTLPVTPIAPGIGTGLAAISITMVAVLVALFLEGMQRDRLRDELNNAGALFKDVSGRVSLSIPFHERDFYSLWPAHVRLAKNAVDITHLGVSPPRNRHGVEEADYFDNLEKIYNSTPAHIRRVERFTPEKKAWIEQLEQKFKGYTNVSLRAFVDPSEEEMPYAISVCRIDDNFAWLVAMAEHESTSNYRDILLTGAESIALVREYFKSRLWGRSVPILDHGRPIEGWQAQL